MTGCNNSWPLFNSFDIFGYKKRKNITNLDLSQL